MVVAAKKVQDIVAETSADQSSKMEAEQERTNVMIIIFIIVAILFSIIICIFITLAVSRGLKKGVDFAKEIALGNMDIELNVYQKDEIGKLADALRMMLDSLKYKASAIETMSRGDFSQEVKKASDKDGLGEALIVMNRSLNELLARVDSAVELVSLGSDQVSQASQSLSQGATEQASSIEEITASANEIGSQAVQNAEGSKNAKKLAADAADDSNKGNEQMSELLTIMEKINLSSDEIKNVVKVIDDIAFQINLLALNANVEAARAGKYGKGFAVVAEEVRNLAVRSSGAVDETTNMVDDIIKNIDVGNKSASMTATQLTTIVERVKKVADFVDEIASASTEQAAAIEEINSGLNQVSLVTQSNTASAEESASAGEELAAQAQQLKAMVSEFKLNKEIAATVSKAMQEANKKDFHHHFSAPASRQSVNKAPIKKARQDDFFTRDDHDFEDFE
ncbi:MAG: methyl-accepting chemotaxis protein [Spirochaetales bacterium]|nr:methyl-accepting chemotaxis protein [Spirochaetales bacterium]